MSFDLKALRDACAEHGAVARVLVAKTAGSAPRPAGTAMLVWDGGQSGTIGGGALEFEAARRARRLKVGASKVETIALGPALGQCCGGSVTLVTEVFKADALPTGELAARRVGASSDIPPNASDAPVLKNGWIVERFTETVRDIWIYGAGHVGRALVDVLGPLPDLQITWVDTAMERFPNELPENVHPFATADPAKAVRHAPDHAEHLILTYSHEFDLQLCHAVLTQPYKSAGLIGSATKWARFKRRLATLGHSPAQIARIACPIGDPSLGKHPQEIAIGVAMSMLGNGTAGGRREIDDRHAFEAGGPDQSLPRGDRQQRRIV